MECNSNCWWNSALYGISSTLTRWLAAALQKRKVAMRLGNRVSMLPQGSPLSPVLYNVCTNGLADLNSVTLGLALTLANKGLIFKTVNKFPTQTNVHAALVLKPQTTSCNPAPPSMTWDARHGPVRWRPTGSFGGRLRHCGRLRTSPYSLDWKSGMAGNAEEEEKQSMTP